MFDLLPKLPRRPMSSAPPPARPSTPEPHALDVPAAVMEAFDGLLAHVDELPREPHARAVWATLVALRGGDIVGAYPFTWVVSPKQRTFSARRWLKRQQADAAALVCTPYTKQPARAPANLLEAYVLVDGGSLRPWACMGRMGADGWRWAAVHQAAAMSVLIRNFAVIAHNQLRPAPSGPGQRR